MITTVKHLIEELQRFNPEARLEPYVEVGGPSYATQCNFKFDESGTVKELTQNVEDCEEENEEQQGVLSEIDDIVEAAQPEAGSEFEAVINKIKSELRSLE